MPSLLANGTLMLGDLRHLLAHRRREMDSRSRRLPACGHLLLHEDGRALDFVVLACAGAVCGGLCVRSDGRGRSCSRLSIGCDRIRACSPASSVRACRPNMRFPSRWRRCCCRCCICSHVRHVLVLPVMVAWVERAASRQRTTRAAVVLAAAAACAVGQPSRWLRLRPRAGGAVRAGRAVECGTAAAHAAGAALGAVRRCCLACVLRNALRLGFDPGLAQDSGPRRVASSHLRMDAGGFRLFRSVRGVHPRRDREARSIAA